MLLLKRPDVHVEISSWVSPDNQWHTCFPLCFYFSCVLAVGRQLLGAVLPPCGLECVPFSFFCFLRFSTHPIMMLMSSGYQCRSNWFLVLAGSQTVFCWNAENLVCEQEWTSSLLIGVRCVRKYCYTSLSQYYVLWVSQYCSQKHCTDF